MPGSARPPWCYTKYPVNFLLPTRLGEDVVCPKRSSGLTLIICLSNQKPGRVNEVPARIEVCLTLSYVRAGSETHTVTRSSEAMAYAQEFSDRGARRSPESRAGELGWGGGGRRPLVAPRAACAASAAEGVIQASARCVVVGVLRLPTHNDWLAGGDVNVTGQPVDLVGAAPVKSSSGTIPKLLPGRSSTLTRSRLIWGSGGRGRLTRYRLPR